MGSPHVVNSPLSEPASSEPAGTSPSPVALREVVNESAVRSVADAAALAWSMDAQLANVAGFEMENVSLIDPDESAPIARAARNDSSVGDGKTNAWLFSYASRADVDGDQDRPEFFEAIVTANGTLFSTASGDDATDLGLPYVVPLETWVLDSEEAARAALADDTFHEFVAEGANFSASVLVRLKEATHPYWVLTIVSEDKFHEVTVDAVNGSVSDLESVWSALFPAHEQGLFTGQLLLTQPEDTFSFDVVEADHPWLQLYVSATGAARPPATVTVTLTSPAGSSETFSWQPPLSGTGRIGFNQQDVPTGRWTVSLDLDSGVLVDYQVTWCAVGITIDGSAPSACAKSP